MNEEYQNSQYLLKLYSETHDIKIRNKIVMLNYGLVRKVVHRYTINGKYNEDLEQVGAIGLIKCIERFNLSRGLKLSAFAISYIDGEIKHYLRDRVEEIRFPRRWQEIYYKVQSLKLRMLKAENRVPSNQEICELLDITPKLWDEIQTIKENIKPISLNKQLPGNKNSESLELGDTLCDRSNDEFYRNREELEMIYAAAQQLDKPKRETFFLVSLQGLNYRNAAKKLDVHHLTISRRLDKAVLEIRETIQAYF
ncbi:sigma-70 family RNA polymerase sigma factor [Chamaesiphon sp.]|uniref:sigma-70 family RNA polymerase sigma factor n=1 Tax=Chamaesiphon sp. TaxID=2814140 RepID=UPI003593AB28